MNNPSRVAYPSELPYSEQQLRDHLREPEGIEGAEAIGQAAVEYVEDYCGITIMETQWLWTLDGFTARRDAGADFWFTGFPSGIRRGSQEIIVPRPKLKQVDSIAYIDEQEQAQVLDPSLYQVDAVNSRLAPAVGESWPITGQTLNAVTITYTSGFANRDAVPRSLRLLVLELVAYYFDMIRQAGAMVAINTVPHGFEAKASEFRQWRF